MSGKEQFVKLPREVLESAAFDSLGINGFRLLRFLLIEHLRQGGRQNGLLLAPRRQLWNFGISAHSVSGAIDETERAGLVDCKRGVGRRPSQYALTWLPMSDGSAPSNRWRLASAVQHSQDTATMSAVQHSQLMSAVSTHNECKTALTKPVASAKQHSQSPKSSSAKQHSPSRRSYQGDGIRKKEAGYSSEPQPVIDAVDGPSASRKPRLNRAGKPNSGVVLDPARPCRRLVGGAYGCRACGKPSVLGTERCQEHTLRAVAA